MRFTGRAYLIEIDPTKESSPWRWKILFEDCSLQSETLSETKKEAREECIRRAGEFGIRIRISDL